MSSPASGKLLQSARSLIRPMSTSIADPVQRALMAERCILVNANDESVGQASKEECHLLDAGGKSLLHRAFSIFVFNKEGELLMQQRSKHKVRILSHNMCKVI